MITFMDKSTMTNKMAAELIRAEGKLGTGRDYSMVTGLRCARGVLIDANITSQGPPIRSGPSGKSGGFSLIYENDGFTGTPEERADFMARLFDGLEEPE